MGWKEEASTDTNTLEVAHPVCGVQVSPDMLAIMKLEQAVCCFVLRLCQHSAQNV